MDLEQVQAFIDGADQADIARQGVHKSDAATVNRGGSLAEFIVDVTGREHRIVPRREYRVGQTFSDLPLEFARSLACNVLHSKCLRAYEVVGTVLPYFIPKNVGISSSFSHICQNFGERRDA